LLDRIPNAVLWLIDDNPLTTANLRKHAQKTNADLERVIFSPRTGHDEFCARLKLCDVYLDTYPYNCGSTTNDVVQAGVPLVTKYGRTMVSRMGLSILSSLNVPTYAKSNISDYENTVYELWRNPPNDSPYENNKNCSMNIYIK
jgi:predicted O-linked N-acetylglucosamine transferase (SPINDLY family)